jgi:hypothetical protein
MTNKKKKFVVLMITTLIITSILSMGCGTVTNYVYEPTAGSMKWVTIDGEDFNPNTDNVAPMSRYGGSIILAQTLRLEGNPYLFVDNGYRKKCIRWNGTKWVNLDGSPWHNATKYCSSLIQRDHSDVSMKLDSNNNPHLIWSEETTDEYLSSDEEIFYARWDNDKWVTVNGEEFDYESGNGNVSKNKKMCNAVTPSFALDSQNIPHVVWVSYGSGKKSSSEYRLINYVTWNENSWVNDVGKKYLSNSVSKSLVGRFSNAEISGDFYAENPIILIDSEDNPCIIWNYHEENYEHCHMRVNQGVFIKKFDGDWVGIDEWMWDPYLGGSGRLSYKFCDFGQITSFDIDSHDSPHLVWTDTVELGNLQISIIKGVDNTWKTLHDEKWGFLHDSDSIHLLWHHNVYEYKRHKETRESYLFYSKWDGENWRTIDGQIFDIQSKNFGIVAITFSDNEYLTKKDLFVDKSGRPHIFWRYLRGDMNYVRGVQVK